MRAFLLFLLLASNTVWANASPGQEWPTQKVRLDFENKVSLQKGAQLYINYCLGCHSLKYQRYEALAEDLGLTHKEIEDNFIFTGQKVGEKIIVSMDPKKSATWFGAPPPDLTLVTRSRGSDWVYTYLKSFYADPSRPWGVNNALFPNVGMPHVLVQLQGIQAVQKNEHGQIKDLKLVTQGKLTAKEYDQAVTDLVNFLTYVGEPMKEKRQWIGLWVLAFIGVFFVFAYLLKKEYWKDIK